MQLGFMTRDYRYIVGKIYNVIPVLYMNAMSQSIVDDDGERICAFNSAVGQECFDMLNDSDILIRKLGNL